MEKAVHGTRHGSPFSFSSQRGGKRHASAASRRSFRGKRRKPSSPAPCLRRKRCVPHRPRTLLTRRIPICPVSQLPFRQAGWFPAEGGGNQSAWSRNPPFAMIPTRLLKGKEQASLPYHFRETRADCTRPQKKKHAPRSEAAPCHHKRLPQELVASSCEAAFCLRLEAFYMVYVLSSSSAISLAKRFAGSGGVCASILRAPAVSPSACSPIAARAAQARLRHSFASST